MLSLYDLNLWARILLLCLLFTSLCAELGLLILLYLTNLKRKLIWRQVFEASLVFYFLVMILAVSLVQINSLSHLMVQPYLDLRLMCSLVPLLAMPVLILERKSLDLLAILALILGLPFMEDVLGPQYAYLLIYAGLFFSVRAVLLLEAAKQDLHSKLSRFSMKEAFDSFPDALVLGRSSGPVLLMNQPMRQLLEQENVPERYQMSRLAAALRKLCQQRENSRLQEAVRNWPEQDLQTWLSFSSQGRTYRLEEQSFFIGRTAYQQLRAIDITRENELLEDLYDNNQKLIKSNADLQDLLDNIEAIQTAKESYKLRNRIHDVLGQRLSVLHMYLQQMDRPQTPPIQDLLPMLEDMMNELAGAEHRDPELHLEYLRKATELAGTTLVVQGQLPPDPQISLTLLQILREASTNAIRHGQARQVLVSFSEDEEAYLAKISNNGLRAPHLIQEGDGISGMRFKLAELGGHLEVGREGDFSLSIRIPKTNPRDTEA